MRKFFVLLPVWMAITLSSCSQHSESYSPYIQFSYFLKNPILVGEKVISADTLSYLDKVGYYLLDTIHVGDSVVFTAGFGSYGNELKSMRATVEPSTMTIYASLPESSRSVLTPTKEESGISFQVNGGYNFVSIPFGYCPKQEGTYQITFLVESDSELSPSTMTIRQPVVN